MENAADTSATIVPEELRQAYYVKSRKNSKAEVVIVSGEPRKESITYDLIMTTSHFFADHGYNVVLRDLYDLSFDPVLSVKEFFYVKDGYGQPPAYLASEQKFIREAKILIFAYPNWHDAPTAIVKGYMEKVFAKGFAYRDGENGLKGLLTGKKLYTIMNCGYLGGGQGYLNDGLGLNDDLWNKYMAAFKVFDDDTANFWGMENAGRFVNDQNPKNHSEQYAAELRKLRKVLCEHLKRDLVD